jgi:hypothetical protein
MPDQESLSHPGERLPNWLARSLSQAFTPRASAVAPQRRSSELSDDEDFDFATSTATTTATTAGGAAGATAATRRGGVHDAFKPSNANAIALTASVGGRPQGWTNATGGNAAHQAPLHQSGLDLAFHNLSFRAGGKGTRGKDILREASGYALAGRLTAVQGPSGAGKVREDWGEGGRDGRGDAGGRMASFFGDGRARARWDPNKSPRRLLFRSPPIGRARAVLSREPCFFLFISRAVEIQQSFSSRRAALENREKAGQAAEGASPIRHRCLSLGRRGEISRLSRFTHLFFNLDLLFFFSFFPLNSHSKTSQSTLLKILACNVSGGEVHGSIYVNGSPIVAREFRAASAVVWQRDILLPTATVREAIMTSAELKLPQRMAWEEKRRRVDQIVQELVR